MSSDVMFRYRLAPTHSAPVAVVKIDDPEMAEVARKKRKEQDQLPWPLQIATDLFVWSMVGLLGYSVYQRFVSGLL